MKQTILDAIRNMQTLSFRYHNEARLVEPYCFGCDNNGHDAIRAFQLGGKGWRLFHLDDISGLSAGAYRFQPRRDYKRNDGAMIQIYAQV